MKKKALIKEFFMEIRKTKARFLSIFVIAALGVAFFAGIRATAPDMNLTADSFYDATDLMDIRILGTLGITQEDLDAVSEIEGVEQAKGAYRLDVLCDTEDTQLVVCMMSSSDSINKVEVTQGRMPKKKNECLADERFLELSGYQIGDTISVKSGTEDPIEDSLSETEYTITGTGKSSMYLNMERGTSTIGNGERSSFLIVPPESFSMDVYTEAVLQVQGAKDLLSGSEAYESLIKAVEDRLEALSEGQCKVRFETIKGDGEAQLGEARKEVEENEQKLADARTKLEEGEEELAQGEEALAQAKTELEEAQKKITDGESQLQSGESQIADGEKQLQDGWNSYYRGSDELKQKKQELKNAQNQILTGEVQLKEGQETLEKEKNTLQEGKKQLEAARIALVTGKQQVQEGIRQCEEGQVQLDEKEKELQNHLNEIDGGIRQYEDGLQQLDQAIDQLEGQKAECQQQIQVLEAQLSGEELEEETRQQIQAQILGLQQQAEICDQKITELRTQRETLSGELAELQAKRSLAEEGLLQIQIKKEEIRQQLEELKQKESELEEQENILAAKEEEAAGGEAQIKEAEEQLNGEAEKLARAKIQLAQGSSQIAGGEQKLETARNQLVAKTKELTNAKQNLEASRSELEKGRKELEEGKQEYEEGEKELEENRQKLEEAKQEYEEKRADAEGKIADAKQQIADAQKELDELEVPKWYILNRDYIETYVEYEQDSQRIKAIGNVFPAIFFLVAALICLTTMTRMVEEERTQIGTLKALGYGKGDIAAKYLMYAFLATVSGSVLGCILGQKILPPVLMNAYGILYVNLPKPMAPLHLGYSITSTALAIFCTTGAAGVACYKEMLASPARLMRPAAPKSGKRVFLERMGVLWKHLSFINKSTIRNLFRYKKRFFMTILGIGGCMALLMVGFGLKDSIRSIGEIQYNDLMSYHAEIVLDEKAGEKEQNELKSTMEKDPDILDFMAVYKTSSDIENTETHVTKSAYVTVPESTEQFQDYVKLRDRKTKEIYELDDGGVILSEKLAKLLDVSEGDTVVLKKAEGDGKEVRVSHITENYFLHYIYMSPKLYQKIYGEKPEFFRYFTRNTSTENAFEDAMQEKYMECNQVTQVSFITKNAAKIANMLRSMDTVIWVLVIAAGMLAFVVLYNLNNINISERIRELATLKVLGFYDREVSGYVLRENLCLTFFGTLLGLGFGKVLHRFIILTAETDIMMFAREIKPFSYGISVILTFIFSGIVNFFMHFRLKKVNMVESMKSVE